MGRAYWNVVGVGAVLTLARFGEAFLILRAQNAGLPLALAPLVLVVMNIVYGLSAYPLGAVSDRIDRKSMFEPGMRNSVCRGHRARRSAQSLDGLGPRRR